MPRAGKIKRKILENDPIYNNRLVTRITNRIMKSGKKTIAQKLVYQTLDILKEKGLDPILTLETAIKNVGPRMEVRPRRVGGASYQVPAEVRGDRREALAIRWMLKAATQRPSTQFHTFSAKLAAELIDANQGIGIAIKKRDETHKMAEANKAFAHFRW